MITFGLYVIMEIMKKLILQILKRFRWIVVALLIVQIVNVLAGLISTVYFQKIIDAIPHVSAISGLMGLLVIYIVLRAIQYLTGYLENYPYSKLDSGIYLWAKQLATRKIARIDYQAYQTLGTGKLIQSIENGAVATRSVTLGFWLRIFGELLPTAVFSLIFIGIYDSKILIALLLGYLIVLAVSFVLLRYLQTKKEQILTHEENFSRLSVRGFMELVVFRINKRFKDEIKQIDDISDHITKNKMQILMIHELFFTLFAYLVLIIEVGVIFYQVNQIIAGASTVGALVALVVFVKNVYQPAAVFNVMLVEYKLNKVALRRFNNFLDLPDDKNYEKEIEIKIDKGKVVFENVNFSYDSKVIFSNLSLTFEGGQATALAGTTGAGKSTIVKLILSLLKPTSGKIYVDEQDLSEVNLESYYNQIAYISQDAPVFDGTLRENMVFDQNVADATIWKILEQVKLDKLVKSLPDGLNTEIGEKGLKLSGGEKQRLAFGRIFFMKPKILILDEPTSALDSATEEFITNNMLDLFNDITLIVIAHRLQTIKNVNRILVFEDGEIIQEGKFSELVAVDGKFKELWQKQTKN